MAGQSGQGTLEVRHSNETSINTSAEYVGVGDVFLIAGQSNAEGSLTNEQSYSHATVKAGMFRQDQAWAELADPTDSYPLGTTGNSLWPLLATLIMADQSVPVAFITTADGGSGLVTPDDWQTGSAGGQYDNCILVVQQSAVNDIKAVLWYQGYKDARNGVSQANYQTALSALLDGLQTDLGFSMPMLAYQTGSPDGGDATRANLDAIKQAFHDRWDNDADIYPGPSSEDINLSDGAGADGLHFRTDAEAQTMANRWWRLIDYALYGGADDEGPRFSSAARVGTTVTVTFTGGSGNLAGQGDETGFRFTDDGTPIAINSASANGTDAVDLVLNSTPSGVELISFASGYDGIDSTLKDSGTYPLPPVMFVDESVS